MCFPEWLLSGKPQARQNGFSNLCANAYSLGEMAKKILVVDDVAI
jgi:hypothetical protein